ncbi:DUF3800 domain-containing protein [Enterococcus casseliflavus]|uniref:DUF3800 domain-containing protein n=1 Tax=Enterococcus casseliflavus TaxID=37734 RepID=UPI0011A165CF|nr:DUF3800 domain-containing protein [Enterococcus casseliflavus]
MEGLDVSIYIDDSGQLHTNYKSDYFVYGGFWCETNKTNNIAGTYSRNMKHIYRTKGEIKTDSMSNKHKRRILRKILRNHYGEVHPIFVATYIPFVTIDFSNKESVQLHKNYILRRLIEDVISEIAESGKKLEHLNVYIDNQSQTQVANRDNLEKYIKNYFSGNGKYLLKSFTTTDANISVSFLESKKYKPMQLADFFANTKYCRYQHSCLDAKDIYEEFSIEPTCRKHPRYFTLNID